MKRVAHGLSLLVFACSSSALAAPLPAQQARAAKLRPVAPFEGVLALAGSEQIDDAARRCALSLVQGTASRVVVLASKRTAPKGVAKAWQRVGVTRVVKVAASRAALRKEKALAALLRADVLWFADEASALQKDAVFAAALRAHQKKGGVIGGAGAAAEALVDRFEVLPNSVLSCDGQAPSKIPAGHVAWSLPPRSTLFVRGRRVGVLGPDPAVAILPARGAWQERRVDVRCCDVFEYGDHVPRSVDLPALLRAAALREGPVFPPAKRIAPEIARGTLILNGGKVLPETFARFVEAAGGKDKLFVCIPSGGRFGAEEQPDSFGAGKLRTMGCKKVMILHARHPRAADEDTQLLAPLEKAHGVWIDGGRTYRIMDAYQHTRAHRMLREVLARGGVVAGSSAGCQVLGDFLVRGNPNSNKDLVFPGYETGFGLLRGVILDAHFRQREREDALAGLVAKHPSMLGIGVDEYTALVVQGRVGEVLGRHAVSFYDAQRPGGALVLESGGRFDLVARKRL